MDLTEIQLEENQRAEHSQYSPSTYVNGNHAGRIVYDTQHEMIHPDSFNRIFVTDSSRTFRINERTNSQDQMTPSTNSR